MKQLLRFSLIGLTLVLAPALSGCATGGLSGAQAQTPEAQERALRQRVEARWDAIIDVDFKRVYEFATPAYRQSYDYKHFANQYAAQIERTGAEVYQVTFGDELLESATVVVMLSFRTEGGSPGTMIDGLSRVVETWVRQDGIWWHVEAR